MTEEYTKTECRAAVRELTPRQREILVKIGACKTRKVIAAEMEITTGTLRIHIQQMRRRLGIHDDHQAIRVALAAGLILQK